MHKPSAVDMAFMLSQEPNPILDRLACAIGDEQWECAYTLATLAHDLGFIIDRDLATIFKELGDFEMSIHHADLCILNNSQDTEIRFLRAESFSCLGKYKEALQDYRKAYIEKPHNSLYYYKLLDCMLSLGYHHDILNFIPLQPIDNGLNALTCHYHAAEYLGDTDRRDEILSMMHSIADPCAEDPDGIDSYVSILFDTRDYDQLLSFCDELDPDMFDTHTYALCIYFQGWTHLLLDEFDLALQCLNEAILRGYNGSDAYYRRAILFNRMHYFDNCHSDLCQSLELDPENPSAQAMHHSLQSIFQAHSDLEEDPYNVESAFSYAYHLYHLGHFSEAVYFIDDFSEEYYILDLVDETSYHPLMFTEFISFNLEFGIKDL